MNKTYCEECNNTDEFGYGVCDIRPYYVSGWWSKDLRYVQCRTRNKNNKCKYFEKKTELPKEPPVKTTSRSKHWWQR